MKNSRATGQAGEYFVAAEICRRGGTATTFAGNMPGFDIVAGDDTRDSIRRMHREYQRRYEAKHPHSGLPYTRVRLKEIADSAIAGTSWAWNCQTSQPVSNSASASAPITPFGAASRVRTKASKARQNEPYARGLTGAISPRRSPQIGGYLTARRIFTAPAEPDLSRCHRSQRHGP
jgi:hypothetical protein